MGAFELSHQEMYSRFNDYGYALVFREHSESLKGKKKGNHEAKDEKIGGAGSLGISPFAPRSVVTGRMIRILMTKVKILYHFC